MHGVPLLGDSFSFHHVPDDHTSFHFPHSLHDPTSCHLPHSLHDPTSFHLPHDRPPSTWHSAFFGEHADPVGARGRIGTSFLAPADYIYNESIIKVDPLGDVPRSIGGFGAGGGGAGGGGDAGAGGIPDGCFSYCLKKAGFHCVPGCAKMGTAGEAHNEIEGEASAAGAGAGAGAGKPTAACDGKLLRSWAQCRPA
eukprot:GEMP01090024.1.p1 GENE.GEMP01090024.1~~GEMP01090024.1.p1  ORF type:complete len:196 (+),score=42.29 GEMP01090024.1:84-671(+)